MSKQNVELQLSSSQTLIGMLAEKAENSGIGGYFKSLWGWNKEQPATLSTSRDNITERDFSGYISDVGEGIGQLKRHMSKKVKRKPKEQLKNVEESTSHIPRSFFSEQSGVYLGKLNSKAEVRRQQERLNDFLDTVEVCLFKQINTRFADFFNMLENIEYLQKAVAVNISILGQARRSIKKVRDMCADRVLSIKQKQITSENRKKVLHVLKLIRQIKAHEKVEVDSVGQLNQTFKSIRQLKSYAQITAQLSERAGKAGSSISKNIFGKVIAYLNVPLAVDIGQRMRQIPCPNTSDGEEFINQTVLLGESRIDGPLVHLPPLNQPAVQKDLSRILEQVSGSIEVSEVAADWRSFMTELQNFHKSFIGELNVVLAGALGDRQKDRRSILSELEGTTSSKEESQLKAPLASLEQNADKVSMVYYGRLVETYHQCLRSVLVRLVGLVSEYMQEIYKMGIEQPQLFVEMTKFMQALLDFVMDSTFALIAKKRLASDCQLVEFHSYIGPLLFWQESLRPLLESKLFLLDYCHASEYVEREKEHLTSCLNRLKQAKSQFQSNFIEKIHRIIVNEQLRQSLKDETWVAASNIPFNYMPVIYYILYGEGKEQQNCSMLNDSLFGVSGDRSRREMSILAQNRKRSDLTSYRGVDFKLLKNAIIVGKKHYRVNVCFLTFVEILEEYLKIQDLYPELKEQVLTKIAEVVEVYNTVSYDMVVCGGALKLDKIKAKIITARHLCLSWSCLQLIGVFVAPLSSDKLEQAKRALNQHSAEIAKRLSGLIRGKTNHQITNLMKAQISGQPCPIPQTVSIASAYKQMLEILQDHMTEDIIREVMRETVDLFVGPLAEHFRQKGERGRSEIRFFLSQLKVLEVGFKNEYVELLKLAAEPVVPVAGSVQASEPTDTGEPPVQNALEQVPAMATILQEQLQPSE